MQYVIRYSQFTAQNLMGLINNSLNLLTSGRPRVRLLAPLAVSLRALHIPNFAAGARPHECVWVNIWETNSDPLT